MRSPLYQHRIKLLPEFLSKRSLSYRRLFWTRVHRPLAISTSSGTTKQQWSSTMPRAGARCHEVRHRPATLTGKNAEPMAQLKHDYDLTTGIAWDEFSGCP